MNTPAVDDHAAIKARMEEIARERAEPRPEIVPEPKEVHHQTYFGWDIHPPFYP